MVPVEQPVEVNAPVEQITLGYAQLETQFGPRAVLEGIFIQMSCQHPETTH